VEMALFLREEAAGSLIPSTGTLKSSIISLRNLPVEASVLYTWQNIEKQVRLLIFKNLEVKYAIKAIQKKRVKDYLTFQNEIKLLRVLVSYKIS